jgi:pimeloyl-ACP methyl ester carboxylesterase
MRNHGDSFWNDDHSYPAMAEDLAEVIASEGGEMDVMGHSMGGKASMVLALTRPALVRRLVVADIAPVAYEHTHDGLIEAMQALKATKGNFQLIGLIHNEHYENDPDVFPSFTAVKKLQAPGGQGGFLVLDDELKPVAPGKIGRRAGEIETAQFLFEVGAQEGEHE